MMLMDNPLQQSIFILGKINSYQLHWMEKLKYGILKRPISNTLYMAIMEVQLVDVFLAMVTTLSLEGLIQWLCYGNRT